MQTEKQNLYSKENFNEISKTIESDCFLKNCKLCEFKKCCKKYKKGKRCKKCPND